MKFKERSTARTYLKIPNTNVLLSKIDVSRYHWQVQPCQTNLLSVLRHGKGIVSTPLLPGLFLTPCEHLRTRHAIMLTMIQYGLTMTQSWIAPSLPTCTAKQDSFSLLSFEALMSSLKSPFSPPHMHVIHSLSWGIWVICGQKCYSRILTKVYGLLALGTLANTVPFQWGNLVQLGGLPATSWKDTLRTQKRHLPGSPWKWFCLLDVSHACHPESQVWGWKVP